MAFTTTDEKVLERTGYTLHSTKESIDWLYGLTFPLMFCVCTGFVVRTVNCFHTETTRIDPSLRCWIALLTHLLTYPVLFVAHSATLSLNRGESTVEPLEFKNQFFVRQFFLVRSSLKLSCRLVAGTEMFWLVFWTRRNRFWTSSSVAQVLFVALELALNTYICMCRCIL